MITIDDRVQSASGSPTRPTASIPARTALSSLSEAHERLVPRALDSSLLIQGVDLLIQGSANAPLFADHLVFVTAAIVILLSALFAR